jgi:hypothetical protein
MPTVNLHRLLELLLDHHAVLCNIKIRSRNKAITEALDKEAHQLFRIITSLQSATSIPVAWEPIFQEEEHPEAVAAECEEI